LRTLCSNKKGSVFLAHSVDSYAQYCLHLIPMRSQKITRMSKMSKVAKFPCRDLCTAKPNFGEKCLKIWETKLILPTIRARRRVPPFRSLGCAKSQKYYPGFIRTYPSGRYNGSNLTRIAPAASESKPYDVITARAVIGIVYGKSDFRLFGAAKPLIRFCQKPS